LSFVNSSVPATDGRRLLDFTGGPDGAAAPAAGSQTAGAGARLSVRLAEISFASRAQLTASAAEACEIALCAMWAVQDAKKQPRRRRIITFENGFHGHSPLLGLAVGETKFARAMEPLDSYFDRAVFNDLASVRALVRPQTAGILVEPLQRKGTFEPPQNGFLMGLRSLADEYDLVLAYDESETGLGRTGALWAHEWSGAAPDLMILGDNLGGGLPLGALLMTKRIEKILGLREGTGHPLAIARAHEVLDGLLAPGFLRQIEERSWAFEEQLYWIRRNHPAVVDVHYGMGLWQTLKLHVPAEALQNKLFEHGVAAITGQEKFLGLLPPLSVTEDEIKQAVAALDAACASLAPVV
jgi:acetylornithine/N-succinyldiaminopimelate aminotransferase